MSDSQYWYGSQNAKSLLHVTCCYLTIYKNIKKNENNSVVDVSATQINASISDLYTKIGFMKVQLIVTSHVARVYLVNL